MKKIKIDAKLYKVAVGHNGFFYPDYNTVIHSVAKDEDLEVRILSYVTGDNSVAAVFGKLPNQDEEAVFFVKKEDILF